ncbi:hypothetical protein [Herbiconiux sp.]|uniref:hypothetical protein n=1 Tax=Herbiconiux sp. TaxID=1871186 RepID=UPI0025C02C85|nr:hypothetical protein [Herbiconiux sp.]
MMIALVLFALVALAGIAGSIAVLARDGYRREPARRPAGWYQTVDPSEANASS